MKKENILDLLTAHPKAAKAGFALLNRLPFRNHWRKELQCGLSLLRGCKVEGFGDNNRVIIGDLARLTGCVFHFEGNGNTIRIGDRCNCTDTVFWAEGDGNTIALGEHVTLTGTDHLAALEGTRLAIGPDCLIAKQVSFRTGDSHSLVRKGTRERLNPAKDIRIGEHVWIGSNVTVLKGSSVADHCTVGANSLVCKTHDTPNCVLAGVPAKVLREDVDWVPETL